MLIKPTEMLTIEGVTAFNSYLMAGKKDALTEFTTKLMSKETPPDSLAFHSLNPDKIAFLLEEEQGRKSLSLQEAADLLRPKTGLLMYSPVSYWRLKKEDYEQFLISKVHDSIPFENRPWLSGYSDQGYLIIVRKGLSGPYFARTSDEVLEFLKSFEYLNQVLSDVEIGIQFSYSLKSLDDLKLFFAENEERGLDFVMRTIQMADGYYFQTPEQLKQAAYLFEPNSKAEATLEFLIQRPKIDPMTLMVDFETAKSNLKSALEKICDFANRKSCSGDAGPFQNGLQILTGAAPAPTDLWIKSGKSAEQYQLLQAALAADAFAGMASWNDVQIPIDEEFHRVSNQVVLTIFEAISAACS